MFVTHPGSGMELKSFRRARAKGSALGETMTSWSGNTGIAALLPSRHKSRTRAEGTVSQCSLRRGDCILRLSVTV